jgi:hypothetical protein
MARGELTIVNTVLESLYASRQPESCFELNPRRIVHVRASSQAPLDLEVQVGGSLRVAPSDSVWNKLGNGGVRLIDLDLGDCQS